MLAAGSIPHRLRLLGGVMGLATVSALPRPLPPRAQWALAVAVLTLVLGVWLRALS